VRAGRGLLTPALSSTGGEGGSFFAVGFPRVAFVPHLPWAIIVLPLRGGSLCGEVRRGTPLGSRKIGAGRDTDGTNRHE
jgi:hypothetical protein